MAEATRKFLDYAGLSKFWGIIDNTFAKKTETVSGIAIDTAKADKTKTQDLIVSYADSTTHKDTVTLPAASDSQAGLMSSDHWKTINDLKYNIDQLAPFAGLEIDGKEVSLDGRRANIKLEYASQGTDKAVIRLVDADWNYTAGAKWETTTESDYTANKDVITGRYTMVQDKQNGTVTYYKWSANEAGPVNSTGAPLEAKPISEIDVTELVKTGLLKSTDVVVNPTGLAAGTYIQLDFWLHQDADGSGDGAATVKTEYINVTDLIDIYTAGDGISISSSANAGADDTARGVTISLKTATDSEVGGIKTAYAAGEGVTKSYAVKVDASGNAFVAVPWETISVTGNGDDYITLTVSDKTELTGSTAADPKYNYDIKVTAGEGIKKAETYAKSSIQSVDALKNGETANPYLVTNTTVGVGDAEWGKAVTVDLTAEAKASLKLADEAVQTIVSAQNRETGVDDLVVSVSNEDVKGQKSYTVGLTETTIASLDKADSALQTITIMGTELDQESSVYTVDNAKDALKLGTAAYVNTSDVVPAEAGEGDANLKSDVKSADGATTLAAGVYHVPTTKAVKTYVDAAIESLDGSLKDHVTATVEDLDSSLAINAAAPAAGVAYDYGQGLPQQILTNIVIEDGKLAATGTAGNTTYANITLKDIVDFAPLSNDDIEIICGLKEAPKAE